MLINIIVWIVFGGVAGYVAGNVLGFNKSLGLVGNVLAGIAGAFVGGFLYTSVFGADLAAFSFVGFIVAVLGAALVLFVLNIVRK